MPGLKKTDSITKKKRGGDPEETFYYLREKGKEKGTGRKKEPFLL